MDKDQLLREQQDTIIQLRDVIAQFTEVAYAQRCVRIAHAAEAVAQQKTPDGMKQAVRDLIAEVKR